MLILSLRKLWVFLLYGFPEKNICVYCLLCLIVVLVVLLVKDPNIMLAWMMIKIEHGIRANLRRRHSVAAEARASYFLGLSPQSIIKKYARMNLHWRAHLSVEAEFDSTHFQFLVREIRASYRRGIFEWARIWFFSSSKSNFRDLGLDFWLGVTPGKSNPSLTSGWKNPKY